MNLRTRLFFLLLAISGGTSLRIHAQVARVYPDAGLWATLSVEKKINKKISVSIDEEFRLKENYSRLNLFYTNLGVNYKFSKKIRASVIYRFTQKADDDIRWSFKHRIMFDFIYKEKLSKRLTFTTRQRFQFENNDARTTPDGRYMESFIRSKVEIGYNINKRLKPYWSEELRFQVVDPRNAESNFGWHRLRSSIGIDYALSDHHAVSLYYLVQNEFRVYKPNDLYITGFQYTYQF